MNKQLISSLIAEFEGLRLKKYKCPAGFDTIGYGHRCTKSSPNSITLEYANKLLSDDVDVYVAELEGFFYSFFRKSHIIELLSDYQIACLVSLVFNIGMANFKSYSVSALVLYYVHGKYVGVENTEIRNLIKDRIKSINKATVNGELKEVSGLTYRRNKEASYWMK